MKVAAIPHPRSALFEIVARRDLVNYSGNALDNSTNRAGRNCLNQAVSS
jgi:hypothetical protein